MLIIISLICGLLLCGLNIMINNMMDNQISSISIGLYDKDDSVSSAELKRYMEDELNMDVVLESDIDYLNSELIEKHISAIIEVPEGFEKNILDGKTRPLEMTYADDYENSVFLEGYLTSYVDSVEMLALPAEGNSTKYYKLIDENKSEKMNVKVESVDKDVKAKKAEKTGLDLTLGFFLMVSFILALGFSSMIFTDRVEGTFNRIRVTSVNTVQYVIGMCLSSIVCSMMIIIPFFIYLGIFGTVLDIPVMTMIFLCLVYSLIVVAISLFMAMLLNTKNSIMAAVVGFTTVTCILGGAFFPLDLSPEFMQQLAQITPQYWFMDSIRVLLDDPDGSWWMNGLILTMFAALFFVLTGARFASTKPRVQ